MTKALQSPPGYAALLKDIKERVRTAQMSKRRQGTIPRLLGLRPQLPLCGCDQTSDMLIQELLHMRQKPPRMLVLRAMV